VEQEDGKDHHNWSTQSGALYLYITKHDGGVELVFAIGHDGKIFRQQINGGI
jgi:hypothetical protein